MNLKKLNQEIEGCKKCILNETRNNIVNGEGNPNADIMLIAQAPGRNEDQESEMFIGPSGKILDKLLKNASVKRKELYMTNLLKCKLPDYRKPKQEEIKACSPYLEKEIEITDPDILVPLGWYSTKYIYNKYNLELPETKSEPFNKLKWIEEDEIKIFPLSHPATLLYDESLKKDVYSSYKKLNVLKKTCKWYRVCPIKKYYENDQISRRWVELYCKGDWENCERYRMEESGEPHSDKMLPDGEIRSELE